ncbi:MAG: outer membrane protein assembly factor BamD [Balneolales bacterium]
MQKTYLMIVLAGLIAAGCASKSTIRPGDTLEEAFQKSMMLYEDERYSDATQAFETVLSIGRGTQTARDAQYYLAESYYNSRQYLIAATEYNRYATNYPRSERRNEAEYKEALSYYEMSPRYNLDQTETYRAIELFQLFVQRNPNSEYVEQARNNIDELRNKLAKKKYRAAELYLRIKNYEASAIYFGMIIEQYPESRWAEQALANQIRAYVDLADNSIIARQEERYEKAVDSYHKYLQIFPRGEHRNVAEEYYSRAMDGLSEFSEPTAGL